jgi:hypothetical protein
MPLVSRGSTQWVYSVCGVELTAVFSVLPSTKALENTPAPDVGEHLDRAFFSESRNFNANTRLDSLS